MTSGRDDRSGNDEPQHSIAIRAVPSSSALTKAPRNGVADALLLGLAGLCYAFWLTIGRFDFWHAGSGFGLTFNSMLAHLLNGNFDVDPAIVGNEGFARDGRVYAYWGPFCAAIRLPLVLIPGGLGIDATKLSCFVAVCVAAFFKLQTLRFIVRNSAPSPLANAMYWLLAATLLFSGAQVEFLRASVYQEVCLWAGAQAAAFVFVAVRCIVCGRFTPPALCVMACTAGLALLTRVSIGLGLYAALCLLLLANLVREPAHTADDSRPNASGGRIASTGFILPLLILSGFAALAGFVNYQRWGDAFVFANFHLYLFNQTYPDRLTRMDSYGLFNLARIPFGIAYYFLPLWVIQRDDGKLLFEEHQLRLIDATELPPSSFLLSAPLLLLLAFFALWSLTSFRRSAGIPRLQAFAIGSGLSIAGLLMLAAVSMNFRYRMEFYPLFEYFAFLGFIVLCRAPASVPYKATLRTAFAFAVVGLVWSHVVMLLYKLSAFGPPLDALRSGVYAYYLQQVQLHFPGLASYLPR